MRKAWQLDKALRTALRTEALYTIYDGSHTSLHTALCTALRTMALRTVLCMMALRTVLRTMALRMALRTMALHIKALHEALFNPLKPSQRYL